MTYVVHLATSYAPADITRMAVNPSLYYTVKLPLGVGTIDILVAVTELPKQEPGWSLIDCRHLEIFVKDTRPYEWDYIPSSRPLWQIVQDIVDHGEIYPTHGTNCTCMDKYAQEIKQHIHRALPNTDRTSATAWTDNFDARSRVSHVLQMVTRGL